MPQQMCQKPTDFITGRALKRRDAATLSQIKRRGCKSGAGLHAEVKLVEQVCYQNMFAKNWNYAIMSNFLIYGVLAHVG